MKKNGGKFPFNKMFHNRKDDDPIDDVYAGPEPVDPIECVYAGPELITGEEDIDVPEDSIDPDEADKKIEEEKEDADRHGSSSRIDVSKIEDKNRIFFAVYAAPAMMDKMSRSSGPAAVQPAEGGTKYCPNCGTPLKKTFKFCPECGIKVDGNK